MNKDGSRLSNCRGIYTRIPQQNQYVRFLPRASHSLNLIGVHASCVTPEMITFFGTLQAVLNYFSGREVLSILKCSLKAHSETTWPSNHATV